MLNRCFALEQHEHIYCFNRKHFKMCIIIVLLYYYVFQKVNEPILTFEIELIEIFLIIND